LPLERGGHSRDDTGKTSPVSRPHRGIGRGWSAGMSGFLASLALRGAGLSRRAAAIAAIAPAPAPPRLALPRAARRPEHDVVVESAGVRASRARDGPLVRTEGEAIPVVRSRDTMSRPRVIDAEHLTSDERRDRTSGAASRHESKAR